MRTRAFSLILLTALVGAASGCEEIVVAGIAAISPPHAPQPSNDDWSTFWTGSTDAGGSQGVYTEWDASGAGIVPQWIQITEDQGLRPVVVLGITSALDDPDKRAALRSLLTALAVEHHIGYVALGNEIDRSSRVNELVPFINELAAFVHSLGTATQVFTTFHYEHMLTLPDPAGLVASLPELDLLGFTTYPFMSYWTPVLIPASYYAPISRWTTKPVAFTEVAWPSRVSHPGYPNIHGSESDQVLFIQAFWNTLIRGLDTRFVHWFALSDTSDWHETDPITSFKQVFASCGLMRNTGAAKPALAAWNAFGNVPAW